MEEFWNRKRLTISLIIAMAIILMLLITVIVLIAQREAVVEGEQEQLQTHANYNDEDTEYTGEYTSAATEPLDEYIPEEVETTDYNQNDTHETDVNNNGTEEPLPPDMTDVNVADRPGVQEQSILHWAVVPRNIVVEADEYYVDLSFRLTWADTPRQPITSAGVTLDFPYESLSLISGSAVLLGQTPGTLVPAPPFDISPAPGLPYGRSMQSFMISGMAPIGSPGWEGDIAFTIRMRINPDSGYLQSTGDTLGIGVTRIAMADLPVGDTMFVTVTRGN